MRFQRLEIETANGTNVVEEPLNKPFLLDLSPTVVATASNGHCFSLQGVAVGEAMVAPRNAAGELLDRFRSAVADVDSVDHTGFEERWTSGLHNVYALESQVVLTPRAATTLRLADESMEVIGLGESHAWDRHSVGDGPTGERVVSVRIGATSIDVGLSDVSAPTAIQLASQNESEVCWSARAGCWHPSRCRDRGWRELGRRHHGRVRGADRRVCQSAARYTG